MPQQVDFEEMDAHEWLYPLKGLHRAATLAHQCMRELDDSTPTGDDDPKGYHEAFRLEMVELTGQAWALLKAIRVLGGTRLYMDNTEH